MELGCLQHQQHCRSTLQAETLSLVAGVEEAEHMRTVMYSMLHKHDQNWRTKAMDFIDVQTYTDCRLTCFWLGLGSTNDWPWT